MGTHVKDPLTCMVFGIIWKGGRSPLVVMQRDPTSRANRYTTNSYIQVLEITLQYAYMLGTFFQQDNAKIHMSLAVKEWFQS